MAQKTVFPTLLYGQLWLCSLNSSVFILEKGEEREREKEAGAEGERESRAPSHVMT